MSCRMYPARSRSRWLGAPASAGSSRSVGMCMVDQRTFFTPSFRVSLFVTGRANYVPAGLEKSKKEVWVPHVGVYRRPTVTPDQNSRLRMTQILGAALLRSLPGLFPGGPLSREDRAGQPGAGQHLQRGEQQRDGDRDRG